MVGDVRLRRHRREQRRHGRGGGGVEREGHVEPGQLHAVGLEPHPGGGQVVLEQRVQPVAGDLIGPDQRHVQRSVAPVDPLICRDQAARLRHLVLHDEELGGLVGVAAEDTPSATSAPARRLPMMLGGASTMPRIFARPSPGWGVTMGPVGPGRVAGADATRPRRGGRCRARTRAGRRRCTRRHRLGRAVADPLAGWAMTAWPACTSSAPPLCVDAQHAPAAPP